MERGVDGSVKRRVTRASLQRTHKHIHTLQHSLTTPYVETSTGTQFIYVPSKDIRDEEVKLADRHASATTVPDTREHHHFIKTEISEDGCLLGCSAV
jgi:hypothetical protein